MSVSGSTPIVITISDAKGVKQRINIFMDPAKIEAVRQFAMLNGVNQGDVMEKAVELMFQVMAELEKQTMASQQKPDFFERLMNDPKWNVRKR